MPKLLMVLVVAVVAMAPLSVSAQEQSPMNPPMEQMVEGIDTTRLLVVGGGVLIGAVALDLLVGADLAVLAGAVAGGILTDWWYRTQDPMLKLPKASYRVASLSTSPGARLTLAPRQ